jgi:methionine-rich copper-binding protein CopC
VKKHLLVLPALAAAFAAVVLAGWSLPASAHAGLVGSDPAQGQRLDRLPASVSLEFTEPIGKPAYVVVTAADGTRVDSGEVKVDGPAVSVALAGKTAASGGYEIAYRVVSEDGHAVAGKVGFTVGADAAPVVETDGSSRLPVVAAVAVGLVVVLGGLLLRTRRRAR